MLLAGPLAIPVSLGRAGIRANKREGDGGDPARPVSARAAVVARRPRRRGRGRCCRSGASRPTSPGARIRADRRYNRPFRRSANEPGDRLWRDDQLYDFIVEIDHNTRPRVAGRGSAVFVHVARPDRSPTAGCVALAAGDAAVAARPRRTQDPKSSFST